MGANELIQLLFVEGPTNVLSEAHGLLSSVFVIGCLERIRASCWEWVSVNARRVLLRWNAA